MKKKIAIITVNYKNYAVTEEFVYYFSKMNRDIFTLFIADLSENRQQLPHGKWIETITTQNKGYAHGVNVGLETAIHQGFEQFVVINNDIRADPDFIHNAQKSIINHPRSIIGGKIYYETGFEYHKTAYAHDELGKVIWYAGGIVDWNNVYTIHRGVDEVDRGQYDAGGATQFITGCLMFFDKAVVEKVGKWDENYFLYYEDADWCERAKRKNVELYYDPSVVIWHKNAQSTGGSGSSLQARYQEKNRVIFGLKYAPFRTKIHLIKNSILKKFRTR